MPRPTIITKALFCYIRTTVLNDYKSESNALYSASLILLGWFLYNIIHFNSEAIATNNTDYGCHIKIAELV